ncbi:MAG: hypothetical protein IJ088_12720 [Clostridia bacterium]|nr:hypothetical protein [Clostridia bacterium]
MRVRGIRRACLCLLLSLVLLGTGGCRQRVHPGHQSAGAGEQDKQELLPNDSAHSSQGSEQLDGGQTQPIQETDLSGQPDEPDGHAETRENPESTRREYDAAANADIRAGEPHRIQSPGDGSGFFEYASDGLSSVARLNAQADKSATQLTFVEESDRVSATETGDAAESALEYYRLLLAERTESLFECKKIV